MIKNSIDFVPEKNGKIILIAEETKEHRKRRQIKHIILPILCLPYKIMALEYLKIKFVHLFKKFYQMDNSATRKHIGTGFGLIICKGIIEAHGGRIWADKSHANGFSIKFTLPFITDANIQKWYQRS